VVETFVFGVDNCLTAQPITSGWERLGEVAVRDLTPTDLGAPLSLEAEGCHSSRADAERGEGAPLRPEGLRDILTLERADGVLPLTILP